MLRTPVQATLLDTPTPHMVELAYLTPPIQLRTRELTRTNSTSQVADTPHNPICIPQATNQGVTLQPRPLLKVMKATNPLEDPTEISQFIRPQQNTSTMILALVFNYNYAVC